MSVIPSGRAAAGQPPARRTVRTAEARTASRRQGMSRRVREALERMLVDRDGEARDRLEDEMEGVKVEVAEVKERVTVLESELREGLHALGEQQAQGMRRLERRLAQVEAGKGDGSAASPAAATSPAPGAGSPSRRRYPELVTKAPPMMKRRSTATPGPW